MTARYSKDFRAHIAALVQFFQGRMRMSEYTIKIKYSDKPDPDDKKEKDRSYHAEMHILPEYLTAELVIYPDCRRPYKKQDWRELADTIAHEVAHLITWPLYNRIPDKLITDDANRENDQATQRIADIVLSQVHTDNLRPGCVA